MFIFGWPGINVPLYYGPTLLGPYFAGAHASLVDTTVAGVEVTLIMTAVIEIFPVSQNALSLGGVMVIFAGLCALAIVFVWKFLPETKELPVEEIVRVFEKQQEESVLHKVA